MKKATSFLFLFFIIANNCYSQSSQLDTIYYDKEWKTVSNAAFASFYRICPKERGGEHRKPFRDYYITGELQSEGGFITLDLFDDSNSIMDGDWTNYFKNGKVEAKGHNDRGIANGEICKYNESGLLLRHAYLKKGKPTGILTEFSEDGNLCYQAEYWEDGTPKHNWYMVSNKDGLCSKINSSTNQPIYESPTTSEIKKEYIEGYNWLYYNANGITLGMTNIEIKDYGKYFQIPIIVTNSTLFPFDFDPNLITSTLIDKKGRQVDLEVLSSEEYLSKVQRGQNWAMFWKGLGEGMAASGAGYSNSTTNTHYNGSSNTYGNAYAYSNGGYAYGNYSGNTTYHGSSTSTTTSYNGLAAYQAQVIASNRMADYEKSLLSERQAKNEGYLKKTTIHPGQSISGYINIKRVKGVSMNIIIDINGAKYNFPWNISH